MWVAEIENAGTVDSLLVDRNYIGVDDYKHGAGVYVSEVWNPQFLAYALAAWNIYRPGPPADTVVEMTVHQPRFPDTEPTRTFTITAAQLLEWRDQKLLPAIEATKDPEAPFKAGDHCMFCAGKTACMAYLTMPKKRHQNAISATPVALPPDFQF